MEATIRLFKALPIEKLGKVQVVNSAVLEKTLPLGFVLSPDVVLNYPDTSHVISLISKAYGLSPAKLNAAFHKSWGKVRDTSMDQLVFEQVIHYLSTYGAEAMGLSGTDSVYIPREALEIPELKDGIKLTVIKGYTKPQLKEKLLTMLGSGVALKEDTITDVLAVAALVDVNATDVLSVKNNEVKIALYDYLGILPLAPVEFLRFIVFKATSSALLIKSPAVLAKIKENDGASISRLLSRYDREVGWETLATIFYRFKPIFLAFRTSADLKQQINAIRRLAVKNHKPMSISYLDAITARVARGEKIPVSEFESELAKVNTFRKIRLAYALKFRTTDADSIMYRVRNGKSWAQKFAFAEPKEAYRALQIVETSIVNDLSKNVSGKKVYIPEGIAYALPATEKQFSGDLPTGTSVSVSQGMLAGAHWNNVGKHRIDLDLSIVSAEHGKIGWNSRYRTGDGSVLFSGDITDAGGQDGATEVFYVGPQVRGTFIVFVNYYNYMENVPVDYSIFVAQQLVEKLTPNYMVDPNTVVAVTKSKVDEKQKIMGIIVATDTGVKFYYAEANLGSAISSSDSEHTINARKYLLKMYTDTISLNEMLVRAGAVMVETSDEADIDLRPENVERDAILRLLY